MSSFRKPRWMTVLLCQLFVCVDLGLSPELSSGGVCLGQVLPSGPVWLCHNQTGPEGITNPGAARIWSSTRCVDIHPSDAVVIAVAVSVVVLVAGAVTVADAVAVVVVLLLLL